jgi:hypothetical protein
MAVGQEVKYKLCALLAVTTVAGCASPKWFLNGRSQQDLNYAYSICEQQATSQAMGAQGVAPTGIYAGAIAGVNVMGQMTIYNMALNDCMRQHGFSRAN